MKTAKDKFIAKKMGNEDEEDDLEMYEMEKDDAIEEHKRLIKILRTGSKEEQLKEADAQEKELNEKILGDKEEEED